MGQYSQGVTRQTARTASGSYVDAWTHYYLNGDSSIARGKQEICQDEAYTYDPCSSAKAYPSFTY